jgi:GNAT superfamily N-acetyltransferase
MPVVVGEEGVGAHNAAALQDLLLSCVRGGASVSFMDGLDEDEAAAFWAGVGCDVEAGRAILFVARDGECLLGSVQLRLVATPNQQHRADVAKLLVHPDARRQGVGRRLMEALEGRAAALGRPLLVLDTAKGSAAEPLYAGRGWNRVGEIPWYALMPDGGRCDTVVFWKAVGPLPGPI